MLPVVKCNPYVHEIALTYSPTHSNTDTVKRDAVNEMNYNVLVNQLANFTKDKKRHTTQTVQASALNRNQLFSMVFSEQSCVKNRFW